MKKYILAICLLSGIVHAQTARLVWEKGGALVAGTNSTSLNFDLSTATNPPAYLMQTNDSRLLSMTNPTNTIRALSPSTTSDVVNLQYFTDHAGSGGGGADSNSTNWFQNAANLTNRIALLLSGLSNDSLFVTSSITNGLASIAYVTAATNLCVTNIVAGTNVTLSRAGQSVTINSSGGGGTSSFSPTTNNTFSANVTINSNLTVSGGISGFTNLIGNGRGLTNVTELGNPMCSVYLTSNQTWCPAGVNVTLPFTNITVDTHSGWDPTNYWYVFPQAYPGIYKATMSMRQGITNKAYERTSGIIREINPAGTTNIMGQYTASFFNPVGTMQAQSRYIFFTGGVHKLYCAAFFLGDSNYVIGAQMPANTTWFNVERVRGIP